LRSPEKINNTTYESVKILIAPLDWGLGHTTRCIPIIKELLNFKCEVWAAGSPQQKALLRQEFPSLHYTGLPEYGIRYGRTRWGTALGILTQVPKILIRIKQENNRLKALPVSEKPDLVISDNRYGLYTQSAFCVFITHQLSIAPRAWGASLLRRLHYRAISRFDRCWVPDQAGGHGLAGDISHPAQLPPIPTRYIGILSRMGKATSYELRAASRDVGTGGPVPEETGAPIDLLVLLSGPEPQRTILERKIMEQAKGCEGRIVLVRGIVEAASFKLQATSQDLHRPSELGNMSENVEYYDHLPAEPLNKLMNAARVILARAGYSTIMDLATLDKPAILVPTPGQPEQEYLGDFLGQAALCVNQDELDLPKDLKTAAALFASGKGGWGPLIGNEDPGSALREEIREVLEIVKRRQSFPALG
jgi:UDP-N-acetylglucosamine transferase subunit ALG13